MMPASSPAIIASNLKWNRKNTLLATVDVEVPKWRLKFHGGMWRAKNGKDWFSFPSREWVDDTGQRRFAVLFEFADPAIERRFKAAALTAIRALAARGKP